MGFCVFVHGIFFFLKLIILCLVWLLVLAGVSLPGEHVPSIFKSKSANRTVPLASLVLRIPVEAVLGNVFSKFLTISSYGIHPRLSIT